MANHPNSLLFGHLQCSLHTHIILWTYVCIYLGFTNDPAGKESDCNAGDLGLLPGLGRSPGVGSGNPLQYSCLKNPVDGGLATIQRVTKSWT